jgi:hypothetical protein
MSLTLDIEIVSAFLLEFDFSWMWDQLHWNFISSSFCAYVECPNLIWYVSCTSIFSRDGHVLQVGLESQTLEFRIRLDLYFDVRISLPLVDAIFGQSTNAGVLQRG